MRDAESSDSGRLDVAMLIQSYWPVLGGAERQLMSLVPLLQSRGIEPVVITRERAGSPASETVAGGPVLRVGGGSRSATRSARYSAGALRCLRRSRPPVVHAFDLLSPTTTALADRAIRHSAVVVKVLRSGSLGDVARLASKPLGSIRRRWIARSVDAFVAISRDIADELERSGVPPEAIHHIPNGVDTKRFAPVAAEQRTELRRSLGVDPDVPLAVFTGRLAPEKRLDRLVELWPEVRRCASDATLVIVGAGPMGERLRASAGEGVSVMSAVDDAASVLGAADVFVLPSEAEGLSNSLLEAMATGLAVVATRTGGSVDAVTHDVTGALVHVGDDDALVGELGRTLADPALRARLGDAARLDVNDRFGIDATAEGLAALYRNLAATVSR